MGSKTKPAAKPAAKEEAKALTLWTPEQKNVLKQVIAPDATDGELEFFGMVCKRTGLDPFSRQIYFVKRKGKVWGFLWMQQNAITGMTTISLNASAP